MAVEDGAVERAFEGEIEAVLALAVVEDDCV